MKAIVITRNQWSAILEKLRSTNKPSTLLVRSKMRDTLGFTSREHIAVDRSTQEYNIKVHIDFYNEHARTMFLLKFSEEINHEC